MGARVYLIMVPKGKEMRRTARCLKPALSGGSFSERALRDGGLHHPVPVSRPRSALRDPTSDEIRLTKGEPVPAGRHRGVLPLSPEENEIERTLIRCPRHDGWPGGPVLERRGTVLQIQVAEQRAGVVAVDAGALEDGPYLRGECHRGLRIRKIAGHDPQGACER